jgi:uncharacterized membrane protein
VDVSALFALGAALCWTMAALFGHRPARELGSLHFNRLRMLAAIVILCLLMILSGRSFSLEASHFWPLVLSSLFGIVMGDFFPVCRNASTRSPADEHSVCNKCADRSLFGVVYPRRGDQF